MNFFSRRTFLGIFGAISAIGIYQTFGKTLPTADRNRWTHLFNFVSRHASDVEIPEICSDYKLGSIYNSIELVSDIIVSDFEEGDVVNVNGWVLSRAEICAANLKGNLPS